MESSEAKLKLSGILDDSTSKVRLKRKKKNGPVEPRRAALNTNTLKYNHSTLTKQELRMFGK